MSAGTLRADKWLWYARLFKSRTLAQRLCESGRLRVNGEVVRKAHQGLKPGDVLTFPKGPHIRVVRVAALGSRRGPASEAQALYEDLAPPAPRRPAEAPSPVAERAPGAGRPTKADRRAIDALRGDPSERAGDGGPGRRRKLHSP